MRRLPEALLEHTLGEHFQMSLGRLQACVLRLYTFCGVFAIHGSGRLGSSVASASCTAAEGRFSGSGGLSIVKLPVLVLQDLARMEVIGAFY